MCIVREMTNAHVELCTLGMTNPTGPIPLEQSQGLPVHQEELGIRENKCLRKWGKGVAHTWHQNLQGDLEIFGI